MLLNEWPLAPRWQILSPRFRQRRHLPTADRQ